jgi:uncharacterized protein (DUF1800 family)
MPVTNRLKNQHLLWRAAFGPMAENAAALDTIKPADLWQLLLETSASKPEKLEVADNLIAGLSNGVKDLVALDKAGKMDEETKKERQQKKRQQSKDDIRNLNILWLDEMINSEAQLREKLSLFWHGHFSCRVINSYFQQELLHIIRTHALGNFGDLLKAVSKSPAMIQFLNNQQNKKKKPNENFAREVMELFTLGRGHYSETDIKEAARAFTGWGFNLDGKFENRAYFHDEEAKTIFGQTGNFNGDDVLNILLKEKQTAKHITSKLYSFLVNEKPDESKIDWLSSRFFKSNYDIKYLLTDIFMSDWFYEPKNIGNHIKSPIELLVGLRRLIPLKMENDNAQLLFQKLLGQILFYPPNVAGWPGGRNWIDSSTLMLRLRIPAFITSSEKLNIRAKSDDDVNMGQTDAAYRTGGVGIDWPAVYKLFASTPREDLVKAIADVLWQTGNRPEAKMLATFVNEQSREDYIRTTILRLMATPEYQLC